MCVRGMLVRTSPDFQCKTKCAIPKLCVPQLLASSPGNARATRRWLVPAATVVPAMMILMPGNGKELTTSQVSRFGLPLARANVPA